MPLVPEEMKDFIIPESLSDNEKSFPALETSEEDSKEKDNV